MAVAERYIAMVIPDRPSPSPGVVLCEQLKIAYKQLPTAIGLGIFLAIVTAWILFDSLPIWLVACWLTLHLVISLIRLFSLNMIASPAFGPEQSEHFSLRYILTALALGSVWASVALVIPYVSQTEGVYIFVLLLSIAGGALASNASHIQSYLSYIAPIGIVLTLQLFILGTNLWNLLGLLAFVYSAFMIIAAWKLNQSLKRSIVLQLNWSTVAEELQQAREGLDRELESHRLTEERLKEVKSELEEAVKHLEHLSSMDELTGLANRRSFDVALAREWSRARRNNKAIALLMIDVDRFKNFNDRYHHQSGDNTLQQVAMVIGEFAHRPGDIAARYGGEEFALILSAATPDHVESVSNELLEKIIDLKIEHGDSDVHQYLTVSIGSALLDAPSSDDYSPLITAADKALYQAKQDGRNRALHHIIHN